MLLSVAIAVLALAWVPAASADARPSATAAKKHLTAKERNRIRRKLTQRLKKNPSAILKKDFLRDAALADYRAPFTIRLARNGAGGFEPSDDELEITWDDSANPWPLGGGMPGQVTSTFLSGQVTMEVIEGGDASGLGELGAMETLTGGGVSMTATPFSISDFNPVCGSGPQLAVQSGSTIDVSSAGARYGVMNMFSGDIRGTIAVQMDFRSQVASSCGALPELTPVVDNSAAPPIPIRYSGRLRISPAITADGKIRLGEITIDDTITPQISSFAYIRSCTGTVSCDPMSFPGRVKLKKMTAELLLGDIN